MDITKHYNYYEFVIKALKELGGSGRNEEILDRIILLAKLNDKEIEKLHSGGPRTVVDYQVAWAKTYLKKNGYIESSGRSIWNLTEKAYSEKLASNEEINSFARNLDKEKNKITNPELINNEDNNIDTDDWIEDLTKKLLSISPIGFERLCQRLFREKGFIKVDVTGKSGDGGIDGIGVLKLSLVSFKVLFQCKRYKGSVGSSDIRDFRGAMSGIADKGVFLTTGHFTSGAKTEASRAGAEPIELIDGVEICNLLKELNLGIKTKEIIVVDNEWFKEFE